MLRTGPAPASVRSHGAVPIANAGDAAPPASVAGQAHWGSLHDAWQDATDACPGNVVPGKEPLPVGVLIAIAVHRVRSTDMLHDAMDHDPGLRRRIDALRAHARDAQGRNWNIPALGCETMPRAGDEAEFRRVVDALRDRFDLA